MVLISAHFGSIANAEYEAWRGSHYEIWEDTNTGSRYVHLYMADGRVIKSPDYLYNA